MKLAGRVAIITGASSGMGRASAIVFASEGARVVVTDIDDVGGERTVAAIKSSGGEAVFVHTDVTIASEVENLIKTTKNKFGKIDIVFNVAGIPHPMASVEDLDELVWDHIYAVNVKSIFLTTKYAAPVLKEAGGGVIINIGSIAGISPRPRTSAYSSSKGAVIALTKALAVELASHNIRVNVINPAATDTPFLDKGFPGGAVEQAKKKLFAEAYPLGRLVRPEEIAYAALYLASDEATMLTGTSINVNAGIGI